MAGAWARPRKGSAQSTSECNRSLAAGYQINQPHMVLAYYPSPGAEPLILDNLEDGVRPASERKDLVPVYSFNDEDVVIARDARKSNPLQIRTWHDLQKRLEAEARL